MDIDSSRFLTVAMGSIFFMLFIILIYYLYSEKFNAIPTEDTPTANDITHASNSPTQTDNENVVKENPKTVDPSDPDYVPPGFVKKIGAQPTKQVFNVSNNIYTYNQAQAVCKAFGADLATYQQVLDAYKKGANWCNYGWTKGQLALYPTQKEAWHKMQELEPERRGDCGKIGINGGYFDNPDNLFGVNCYGIKPEPRDNERMKVEIKSPKEYELERQVAQIKRNLDSVSILPFSHDKWSSCSV